MLIILITLLISDQHVNVSSYVGETLKGEDPSKYIRQKYGHHGPGVDHNQQFDNGIMGLNSLKEARDKNNKIIYSSGLSCFQPH